MTASRAILRIALCVCVLASSSAAYAQPSAAQKETARGLMASGRELREQGDLRGALSRFTAADALMGVPTTGYEVAATQAEMGELVEARETLRRVLASPRRPSDPAPFNDARVKARALDQRLQNRIGALHFNVTGVSDTESLSVDVDGENVPRAALGMPFRVNPGKHLVVARSGAREVRAEVEVLESRTVKVELGFVGVRATPGAPSVALEDSASKRTTASAHRGQLPRRDSSLPALVYIGGGGAVVGLALGSVAGVMALSHKSAASSKCMNGQCPPSTWNDLDSAKNLATISTVGFIVGAVGVAVATSSLLLREESPPRSSTWQFSPELGPRSARLSVTRAF